MARIDRKQCVLNLNLTRAEIHTESLCRGVFESLEDVRFVSKGVRD